LLDRRFRALESLARGEAVPARALGAGRTSRALASGVLGPLEARWHDGDENLVRGALDRWLRPGDDTPRALAGRLLEAGRALDEIAARPQAWWFYLWELESMLGLVSEGGHC
jgi:hypothetical protein